jgi:flagellar motility protein MotE (MotC chaperone)
MSFRAELLKLKLARARFFLGPIALFILGAGGTWIALSSPQVPAAESEKGDHAESPATEAGNKPKAEKKSRKPASLESQAAECLTDETALSDIQKRRDDLDKREKELEAKGSDLEAKEKAIGEQLKKIEEVREDIRRVEDLRSKEQGLKVGKVVETFETMTPKSVSAMLSSMDEQLAVEAMNRMTTPKLAKVMNLMEPNKSARLTELLVGVRAASGREARISETKKENLKSSGGSSETVDGRTPSAVDDSEASEKQ